MVHVGVTLDCQKIIYTLILNLDGEMRILRLYCTRVRHGEIARMHSLQGVKYYHQ
jgi:hypothetical protein